PAARATSSMVVFEYPSTPMSRSAASRIRSRVGVGFIVGVRSGGCNIARFRFFVQEVSGAGSRFARRGLADGRPVAYRLPCSLSSHGVRGMTGLALLCLLPGVGANPPGPLDLEPGDLRPGLVAEYRSLADPRHVVSRVEPKPAFHIGRSSPHPRLPPGPFEVTWSGVIALKEPGPLTFWAFVGGELTVTIDGVTVLEGRGPTDAARLAGKAALKREPGSYRVAVRYRSLADVPARLQLWWEGPTFAAEPLPPWRLGHLAADRTAAVEQDERAARGRDAVGRLGCARCHSGAFPAVSDPPPGPSLADAGRRRDRGWLLAWPAAPAAVRPGPHMPAPVAAAPAGL